MEKDTTCVALDDSKRKIVARIPQLVAIGQQHFEDATLRIRATDRGQLGSVRCGWGA